jgi:outer membrane protein TolC
MNKTALGVYTLFFAITYSFSQSAYSFDTLVYAMLNSSAKLKRSEVEVMIAKERVDAAYSGYYPTLRLASNIERSKKFESLYTPSYVGDDSLTQSDGKYLSASLYFSYDIYRFKAVDYSVSVALENVNVINAAKCIEKRDNILSLLENYSNVRIRSYQIKEYKKIERLYAKLYALVKRLNESGMAAKTDGMEYAKELADVAGMIASFEEEIAGYLLHIGYLSGINVQQNDILEPIDTKGGYTNIPFEESLLAQRALALIAQKQAELRLQKTNYLPTLSFYARYDYYGSSTNSYSKALEEFGKNGYRFGISFSVPLFDGFKSRSEVNIKSLELMQSTLEYDDAKRVYEKEASMLESQINLTKNRLESIERSAALSSEIVAAQDLLNKAGEADSITLLESMIEEIRADILKNEASEILSASMKKREIMNKESQCAAR